MHGNGDGIGDEEEDKGEEKKKTAAWKMCKHMQRNFTATTSVAYLSQLMNVLTFLIYC